MSVSWYFWYATTLVWVFFLTRKGKKVAIFMLWFVLSYNKYPSVVPVLQIFPNFLLKIFFYDNFWSDFQMSVYLIEKCGLQDHAKSINRFLSAENRSPVTMFSFLTIICIFFNRFSKFQFLSPSTLKYLPISLYNE